MLFGLIGKSLSHSFSPTYFAKKFEKEKIDASYKAYELSSIQDFPQLISEKKFQGLNVTIPYKEDIIPFLDELDNTAELVGAVNTICFERGRLIGRNTDAPGFWNDIKSSLSNSDKKAIILGSGGASKAVKHSLEDNGIDTITISRTSSSLGYDDLDSSLMREYSIVVNTTPVGMYPNENQLPPIPIELIGRHHLVYDLIYNPKETALLKAAKTAGARAKNGYGMLINQAELSFNYWMKNT